MRTVITMIKQIDEDYYKNEGEDSSTFERILHWYVDYFGSSPGGVSILFPIGALRALRRLMSFRLVLNFMLTTAADAIEITMHCHTSMCVFIKHCKSIHSCTTLCMHSISVSMCSLLSCPWRISTATVTITIDI
jgi:hypothetical protein